MSHFSYRGDNMMYIATYDIPQEYPKIRRKISLILKNWGLFHLQYSVFIGDLSRNHAESIALQIDALVRDIPADVRMYQICDRCLSKAIIISDNPIIDDPQAVVF
ncbi:MAG: CRISPR-associated endonuclease Cas2 [Promethearchaeota archaeon]|nr:MAG: CRISPR-associated endonuclease Cas2 [Candidatus Lokiarchaeota archaeon]